MTLLATIEQHGLGIEALDQPLRKAVWSFVAGEASRIALMPAPPSDLLINWNPLRLKMVQKRPAPWLAAAPDPVQLSVGFLAPGPAGGAVELRCDVCDEAIEGEQVRRLYLWTRSEESVVEDPALCQRCAVAIGVTSLSAWSVEEEP